MRNAGPTLTVVVGPTASGKSDLALDLAQKQNAIIVNADALQLYRGMDIGTAKLSVKERRGIPHEMIDLLDVTEEAAVAAYQTQAREVIDSSLERGQSVVIVGGSGLYIKAILDPLVFPDTDPVVRDRLNAEAEEVGAAVMHQRLATLDPAAAAAIIPANVRRVVRALEVIEITGQPFTATLPREDQTHYPQARQIGIQLPAEELEARIAQRTISMWERGLIDEVRALDQRGLREGKTASRALGYAQALAEIDGRMSHAEAIVSTSLATRQYAKRQWTWFKRDQRIEWITRADAALIRS
jgi:tRNA dimethylallyltransferase